MKSHAQELIVEPSMPSTMPPVVRASATKHVTVALFTVVTFLVVLALRPALEPYALLPLLGVVAFSARQAGLAGGWLSGLTMVIGVWYFFVPPNDSFALNSVRDAWGLVLFAGTAAVLILFARPRRPNEKELPATPLPSRPMRKTDPISNKIPGLGIFSVLGVGNLIRLRRALKSGWEGLIAPHVVTHVIQTLLHVGLFDALKHGAVDVVAFAETHNLDGPLLLALCDELYARRLFRKSGTSYCLDTKGRFLLETRMMRGWFELVYGYECVLSRMEGLLRREIVYGRDVVRDGKYVAEGSGLASADFYFPLVIQMVRQAGYRKILDIGCGDGTFLRYICEQMPGLEGVGIDLSPEAVASGNEQLKRDGLDGRIRLYVGDALEIDRLQPQLRGVDCAATFFVLHELCDQKDNPLTQKFLLSFRDVLPGVPLHIVETIRPTASELRERPGPAIEYFLLHDLSGQKPISREAWKELFRRCGFESVQERYLGFSRSSIFKVR